MDCFFINLDRQAQRRAELEASFAKNNDKNWRLSRFSAVDANSLDPELNIGSLTPNEKACFLSHRSVIENNLQQTAPFFVLEDDVCFGKDTFHIIELFMQSQNNAEWDLIFTDVCVPGIVDMLDLLKKRRLLAANGKVELIDLSQLWFAGATAYIVNHRSAGKLHALLAEAASLNIPYDLYLRNLIRAQKLRAFTFFPFLTTLAESSDQSQIQHSSSELTEHILNTYRRMIWQERDANAYRPTLDKLINNFCDAELADFGMLISLFASDKFDYK